MSSEQTFTGGCLCGNIAYEVTTNLKKFYFCHCKQCQKITGSAFASNLLTKPSEIHWLKGQALLKRFDYPDRSFTKVFCQKCGSGLPFLNASGSTLLIPAGSLDHAPKLSVDHNIFWEEHADWYETGLSSEKANDFPPHK